MRKMWGFLTLMGVLIPAVMLLIGYLFQRWIPPRNYWFGYRSGRALKSDESWMFAQHLLRRYLVQDGWILFPVSLGAMIVSLRYSQEVQEVVSSGLVVIQVIFLLGIMIPIESALKKKFG